MLNYEEKYLKYKKKYLKLTGGNRFELSGGVTNVTNDGCIRLEKFLNNIKDISLINESIQSEKNTLTNVDIDYKNFLDNFSSIINNKMNDIEQIKKLILSKIEYLAFIKTLEKGDMVKDEKGFLYIVDKKNDDWIEQTVCDLEYGSIFVPSESRKLPLEGTIIKDNRARYTINVSNGNYNISIKKENSSEEFSSTTIKKNDIISLKFSDEIISFKVVNVIDDEILILLVYDEPDQQINEKLYKVYDIKKFLELSKKKKKEGIIKKIMNLIY